MKLNIETADGEQYVYYGVSDWQTTTVDGEPAVTLFHLGHVPEYAPGSEHEVRGTVSSALDAVCLLDDQMAEEDAAFTAERADRVFGSPEDDRAFVRAAGY
jgi:hypothetical protein